MEKAHLSQLGLALGHDVDRRHHVALDRSLFANRAPQANFCFAHGGTLVDLLKLEVESHFLELIQLIVGQFEVLGVALQHTDTTHLPQRAAAQRAGPRRPPIFRRNFRVITCHTERPSTHRGLGRRKGHFPSHDLGSFDCDLSLFHMSLYHI